jgi:hypothetical protein
VCVRFLLDFSSKVGSTNAETEHIYVTYQYAQFAAAVVGTAITTVVVDVTVTVVVTSSVMELSNPNCITVRVGPSHPGGFVG